jgi:hypothetical protein
MSTRDRITRRTTLVDCSCTILVVSFGFWHGSNVHSMRTCRTVLQRPHELQATSSRPTASGTGAMCPSSASILHTAPEVPGRRPCRHQVARRDVLQPHSPIKGINWNSVTEELVAGSYCGNQVARQHRFVVKNGSSKLTAQGTVLHVQPDRMRSRLQCKPCKTIACGESDNTVSTGMSSEEPRPLQSPPSVG